MLKDSYDTRNMVRLELFKRTVYNGQNTHVKHFNFHNPDKIRSGRNPANIYLFQVSKRNFRKMCLICSKLALAIISLERRHRRRSGVFSINFQHISHLF